MKVDGGPIYSEVRDQDDVKDIDQIHIPGLSENNVDVDEESSDLVLNSEPIDWNSGGGRSDQAVDVETDTLILINPRGGDKSDQT